MVGYRENPRGAGGGEMIKDNERKVLMNHIASLEREVTFLRLRLIDSMSEKAKQPIIIEEKTREVAK